MSGPWPRIVIWAIVFAVLAIFANWPQNGGTLKPWIWHAGFPFTHALWKGDEVVEWRLGAFLINLVVWLVAFAAVVVGILLAHSNHANDESPQGNDQQRVSQG